MHSLTVDVGNLQEEMSLLQTMVRGMQALMSTVCDVVFQVDSEFRVTSDSTRLSELLGPVQGCCLTSRLENAEQLERFNSVASHMPRPTEPPTGNETTRVRSSGDSDVSAVLVPPVRLRSVLSAAGQGESLSDG